ncbi:MAG: hypothetical protein WC346_15635 [Methanogenium sp.]|jgi:hypothetical protein
MSNWRQILSWKEPETLVGWLVEVHSRINDKKFYKVITNVIDENTLEGPSIGDTPRQAIEYYKDYIEGRVLGLILLKKENWGRIVIMKKVF